MKKKSDLVAFSKSCRPDGRAMSRLVDSLLPEIVEASQRISLRSINKWLRANKDIYVSVNCLCKKVAKYRETLEH